MCKFIATGLLAVTMATLSAGHAQAQVSAEALSRNPFTAGFGGTVAVGLALARGNTNYVTVSGSATVLYQTLHDLDPDAPESQPAYIRQRGFLTGYGKFAEKGDEVYVSQAYTHARWTAMWHPMAGTEVFGQFQFNDFIRLQRRALGGVGGRFELVHLDVFQLTIGTAWMLEYERLEVAVDPESLVHRWSNYVTARAALFDDALIAQNTLYVQPRFDAPEDFRVLNVFELVAGVTKHLALGIDLSYKYDSQPPAGVGRYDLTLETTLRVSF